MQGIYILRHTPTGKLYVGSSRNLAARRKDWWRKFNTNPQNLPEAIRAINTGRGDWEFKVIWTASNPTPIELKQCEAEAARQIYASRPDLLLNTNAVDRPELYGIEVNGVTDTIIGWSRRMGINDGTIWARLKVGWSPEEAVGFVYRPAHVNHWANPPLTRVLDDDGKQMSIREAATALGCSYHTLSARLRKRRVKYNEVEVTFADLKNLSERFRLDPPIIKRD